MRRFENPYNFIPAVRRQPVGAFADAPPAGHDRVLPDHWQGRISVRLITQTPLLLPDASLKQTDGNEHKTYGIRRDAAGNPYLPPTSVKGMLRSAFEALSNSRLGVFEDHGERLAYRMAAKDGLKMLPVRIQSLSDTGMVIKFMNGNSDIGDNGTPAQHGPMYAAWLGQYKSFYLPGTPPHLTQVHAYISLWQHGPFRFWNVEKIQAAAPQLPTLAPQGGGAVSWPKANRVPFGSEQYLPPAWVEAYVYRTGRNIKGKHHERLFFANGAYPLQQLSLADTARLTKAWRNLIQDYQAAHDEKALWQRKDQHNETRLPWEYLGDEPGKTAWSRHIYLNGRHKDQFGMAPHDVAELREGDLCYAMVRRQGGGWHIDKLYPVMIARDLFEAAPVDLLDSSLLPANSLAELSPADRVFGWVRQEQASHQGQATQAESSTAYKGQLRLGATRCLTQDAIEPLEPPVPLAILGQPKPSQANFYCAQDETGAPLTVAKAQGYQAKHGLRGRKVYPHHRLSDSVPDYWAPQGSAEQALDPSSPPNPSAKMYREWRRVGDAEHTEQSDQNRSMSEWIKPGSEFCFDLHLSNLQPAELGALLHLLTLAPGEYLRLGGGKPLGFGSVRLEISSLDLMDGQAWAAQYRDLLAPAAAGQHLSDPAQLAKAGFAPAFRQALEACAGKSHAEHILKAFKHATQGGRAPVHYPRPHAAPSAAAENFKWFGQNPKTPLPALWQEERFLSID